MKDLFPLKVWAKKMGAHYTWQRTVNVTSNQNHFAALQFPFAQACSATLSYKGTSATEAWTASQHPCLP